MIYWVNCNGRQWLLDRVYDPYYSGAVIPEISNILCRHIGYLSIDQTHGYYRGPSMQALTRIIFGFNHAKGKLPINVPNPNKPTDIIYPRGHGLLN